MGHTIVIRLLSRTTDMGNGAPWLRTALLPPPCPAPARGGEACGPVSAGPGRVEAVPAFADGRHDLGDPGVEGVKFLRLGRVGDERTSVT